MTRLLRAEQPLLAVDACGAINLAALLDLRTEAQQLPFELLVVQQVADEAMFLLEVVDGEYVRVPINLGTIRVTELEDGDLELYVRLARGLDDGEAATLAFAYGRQIAVLTDDRKAVRIAGELDPCVPIIGTPELARRWASAGSVAPHDLMRRLVAVESLASFRPRSQDPNFEWWRSITDGERGVSG